VKAPSSSSAEEVWRISVPKEMWGGQSEMSPKKDYKIFLADFIYMPAFEQVSEINQSRINPALDLAVLFL
jgi:hypothetical protein